MRRGTYDHPKTYALAKALGCHRAEAFGLVNGLLDWAYGKALRGDVGKWTDEEIAFGAGYEGKRDLIAALVQSRWLDRHGTHRLVIHDLHEHADDTWRKQLARKQWTFANLDPSPDMSGQSQASPSCLAEPGLALPCQAEPGHAAPTRLPAVDDGFAHFWSDYPKKLGKTEARKAWSKLRPSADLQREIAASVAKHVAVCRDWQRDGGRYIPNASTFLNQRRWDDDPTPPTIETAPRLPDGNNPVTKQAVTVAAAQNWLRRTT